MPELDIDAAAREVADLLNCNQTRQAMHRLDALREGQSLVVQEALDRSVATGARDQLIALALPGVLAARDVGEASPVLERLRAATGSPRFPEASETAGLSQTQLHDVYASIVGTRGNSAAHESLNQENERVILGMRNETQTTFGEGIGNYDDRMVVLWKDDRGNRHALELNRANTEPSAQYDHHAGSDGNRRYAEGNGAAPALQRSPGYEDVLRRKIEGEDVNGDSIRDLGRLGEGTTEMTAATHPTYRNGRQNGNEFALRPSQEAVMAGAGRVQRDTNADGWFTATDLNGVQDLNNTFKIHRGNSGDNTDSAGCQTISGTQYDAFIAEVQRSPQQNRWQYVLTSVEAGPQPQQERGLRNEGQPRRPEAHDAVPAPLLRHPANPEHRDHDLHRQIRDRVGGLGLGFNESGEQLSLSLLAEAKSQGLLRVDHLFANQATAALGPGELLFLVQGAPNDPVSPRAMVHTDVASRTPVEESLSRMKQLNRTAINTRVNEPQRIVTQDAPGTRLG